MQVWCRWDQNCVRIDSKEWARTKSWSSPDKEKPNSCWVFPVFSPGKRTNSCFGKVFDWLLKKVENISKSDMIKFLAVFSTKSGDNDATASAADEEDEIWFHQVWLRDVRRWRRGLNWGAIGVPPQGKWSHTQSCFLVPWLFWNHLSTAPPCLKCFVLRLPAYISPNAQITSLSPFLYFRLTLPLQKLPAQESGLGSP